MTHLEHRNPTSEERTAWAPYNFVPLPEAVVAAEELPPRDSYDDERLNGAIHCTLTTETPLYTRAALELDEYGSLMAKDKADFFYVNPATREPVIPGSTLRGMLRSLVEIIVYGKPQPVTDRQMFFRSLDTSTVGKAYSSRMTGGDRDKAGSHPNVSAGYMERRGHDFLIRPAQALEGVQYYRVEEDVAMAALRGLKPMARRNDRSGRYGPNRDYRWRRQDVWFKPVPPISHKPESAQFYAEVTEISVREMPEADGWRKGAFIASGWVPSKDRGKHLHWIVGSPDDSAALIPVAQIDVDAYEEMGAGRSQKIDGEQMSVLPKPGQAPIPCFFIHWQDSEAHERIAFGHTAMFRLPYEKSPRDLIPSHLADAASTDIAEAIFGWVDDRKGRQIAGRVYVGDAHVEAAENGLWVLAEDEPPIRSLLSSPKPTSFQHYLTQPTDVKDELLTYDHQGKTTLRGHKLYWHKRPNLRRSEYHDSNWTPDSKQHTSLRPVKEGVTFAFDIRFENLTPAELGAVLWGLTVCGAGERRLKLGMVKPYGLGTVRVEPTLHLSDRLRRYRELLAEWDEAADAPEPIQPYVTAFETRMWEALPDAARQGAQSFRSLKRIHHLLTMLRWPGPRGADYMSFAQNEFKERPVLPDPQSVWDDNKPEPLKKMPTAQATPVVEAMVIEVKGANLVVQVEDQRINLQFDQLPQKVSGYKEVAYLHPVGSILHVKVEQSKSGKLRATAKDVPQP